METLNKILGQSGVIEGLTLTLTAVALIYTAIRGAIDFRDLFYDLKDRIFTTKEYRVKTTIMKTKVRKNQIERVKLRTVRVFVKSNSFTFDPLPQIVDEGASRVARIIDHYAVPGRTIIDKVGKEFVIKFSKDEELSLHKDHSVVLGYRLKETIESLYGKPGMIAIQPVGEETLVVEYHFPPGWHLKTDHRRKPVLSIYTQEKDGQIRKLPAKKILIEGGKDTFDGNGAETDWFRVTIKKPPQGKDDHINIDWVWDKKGETQHGQG